MRKNRLFHFAAAVTGFALCITTAHTNAADEPVANPPPEEKAFASGSSKQE